jgi:hypothetical protein
MSLASARSALHELVTLFADWHESFARASEESRGLPAGDRQTLLDELKSLSGDDYDSAHLRGTRWLNEWLGARRLDVEARERALLKKYEQACELSPPTSVLNALLRQHRTIKEASLRDRARSEVLRVVDATPRLAYSAAAPTAVLMPQPRHSVAGCHDRGQGRALR